MRLGPGLSQVSKMKKRNENTGFPSLWEGGLRHFYSHTKGWGDFIGSEDLVMYIQWNWQSILSRGKNFKPGWTHLHFYKFTMATVWRMDWAAGVWRLGEAIMVIPVRNYEKVNCCLDIGTEMKGQCSRQWKGNIANNWWLDVEEGVNGHFNFLPGVTGRIFTLPTETRKADLWGKAAYFFDDQGGRLWKESQKRDLEME